MIINDLGIVPNIRTCSWNRTAIDCYKRGCNCKGCFYQKFFEKVNTKCRMKAVVLELVRVLGKPKKEKLPY